MDSATGTDAVSSLHLSTDDGPPANLFQLDPGVGEALVERLTRLRRARDAARAARALDALETAARGRDNLVPLLIEAVEASVTLGFRRLRAKNAAPDQAAARAGAEKCIRRRTTAGAYPGIAF